MNNQPMNGLITGVDGKVRCWWHGNDPEYLRYHDEEWGRPVSDDRTLFEKLCLEGFQAGLSWLTILRKRDNFRDAFANFQWQSVADFTNTDIERLLHNKGIIRHRGKIEATIHNARQMPALLDEYGSFANYLWRFEPATHTPPHSRAQIPAIIPESIALSKDFKHRGFKFVGPTTMYALMQAMGLVNDHIGGCCMRDEIEKIRQKFARPLSCREKSVL